MGKMFQTSVMPNLKESLGSLDLMPHIRREFSQSEQPLVSTRPLLFEPVLWSPKRGDQNYSQFMEREQGLPQKLQDPGDLLRSKSPPFRERKRKASWSGFEETLSKVEEAGRLARVPLPSSSKLNQVLPSNHIEVELDDVEIGKHDHDFVDQSRDKMVGPKLIGLITKSRPKKRSKKLEVDKCEEKYCVLDLAAESQPKSVSHIWRPIKGELDVEEEKASKSVHMHSFGSLAPSNNIQKWDANMPSKQRENHGGQLAIDLEAKAGEENNSPRSESSNGLQVGLLGKDYGENKFSSLKLANSLRVPKLKRRIKMMDANGLEGRYSVGIGEQRSVVASNKKSAGQWASPIGKPNPITSHKIELPHGNKQPLNHLNLEREESAKCSSFSFLSVPPSYYIDECYQGKSLRLDNDSTRREVQVPNPSSRKDDVECVVVDEGSTKDGDNNAKDILREEDFEQAEGDNAHIRVKKLLMLFRVIHRQFRGGHKEVDVRNIIAELYPQYLLNGTESIYGDVPGVEAGDRFSYRVEMDLVGLHHHLRRGIDVIPASKSKWQIQGKPASVAACVVIAGGYVDNRDEGDIVIYTGEGGNNHQDDKGPSKDQTLTFGNMAMRHSMMLGLFVRVVRKFDNKPPLKPYYRYDGLYEVMEMKKERSKGIQIKDWSHEGGHKKLYAGPHVGKPMSSKPLVYKFVLLRKSARKKYKNVNLWTCMPPSFDHSAAQRQQNSIM